MTRIRIIGIPQNTIRGLEKIKKRVFYLCVKLLFFFKQSECEKISEVGNFRKDRGNIISYYISLLSSFFNSGLDAINK